MGIFLDKFGHYTVETSIALALGIRAAGGVSHIDQHVGWVLLGALFAWLLCLNKALNDMVHAARALAGAERLPDNAQIATPRIGILAMLRHAARLVPFHRIYHSIEMTLIVLAAAIVDTVRGDLGATRVLLAVIVPLAAISVAGHFVAIVTSSRVRAA